MTEETFFYVKLDKLLSFLAVGWEYAADLGEYHGQWSVLMKWPHSTEPVIPQ